jgi:hypothetical protein
MLVLWWKSVDAAAWYVQNVSTFPNTFVVVSPLVYVFWIQVTRTNVVFSKIALVSCFCAEIQLSEKILENTAKILFYQKTHGARIRDEEGLGGHHTTWWRGPSLAAPGCGEPPQLSPRASFRLQISFDLKLLGVRRFSQIEFCCAATIRNRNSEAETLFWHPARTGIWRRSSSSSPTYLHQPSMTPSSMCE